MTTAKEDIAQALLHENKDEQKTLPGVIRKMKTISVEQYDGKMYDNIYSIFNQLLVSEKRLLLKGLINICFIVEDRLMINGDPQAAGAAVSTLGDIPKTALNAEKHIDSDLIDIDEYNKREMIRLKSWFTKAATIGLIVALAGGFIAAIYLSSGKGETLGMFSEFGKVLAEVLGL